MKRILLTRSEKENKHLSKCLKGFDVISLPLISYRDIDVEWNDFRKYSYLIVTSKYAAQLVAKQFQSKAKILVVGKESASILKSNDNLEIENISNNVSELKSFIYESKYDIKDIIYFSGNIITSEFENIVRKVIYEVYYAKDIIRNDILENVDYVLLYSKNTAKALINILKKSNLLQNIRNSVVIAMSASIGDIIADHVDNIIYPDEPSNREIIQLLHEHER